MRLKLRTRLPALALALTMLFTPAASALTTEQAAELLQDYYIDEVPQSVLDQPTVQDMVTALGDPYTQYFTAEEYALFTSTMTDTDVVGVGLYSQITEDGLLVLRVYRDTPAADGGLQAGDLVIAVDGQSVTGDNVYHAAALLQGEADTQVAVTFLRDGVEQTVTLIRQAITIPATYSELWDGHIGYIDCDTFGSETLGHFLEGFEDYGGLVDHWIVDLQDNGGGELGAAASAAACFMGPGLIAYVQDNTGGVGAYGSDLSSQTIYPVIVLTNGNTASASEIFAAAIKDNNAGILVGGRTYGKGVAQSVFDQSILPDYFPDGDAIKITSYRIYGASASTHNLIGLIPHLLVDPDLAADVAKLLSGTSPTSSTLGYLRIDFGWRWYVNLDTALSDPYRAAFLAMLEALPETVRVWEGTGGSTGWAATDAATLASKYGLTEYEARTFTDIEDSAYRLQIQLLATYEILQGDGTGAFQPEEELTRAQLCALLAQALNCSDYTGSNRFSDVDPDSWYAGAVNTLASMGLVEGVGGGRFDPDAPVDHEQFITLMSRLGQYLNLILSQTAQDMPEDALANTQLDGYADWAKESVWLLALSQHNLFGGTVNLLWDDLADIDPAAVTTREEAAALTYTLLSYIGVLPV